MCEEGFKQVVKNVVLDDVFMFFFIIIIII